MHRLYVTVAMQPALDRGTVVKLKCLYVATFAVWRCYSLRPLLPLLARFVLLQQLFSSPILNSQLSRRTVAYSVLNCCWQRESVFFAAVVVAAAVTVVVVVVVVGCTNDSFAI